MSNITGNCTAIKPMQLCLNKDSVTVPDAGIRWINDTSLPSGYNMRIPYGFVLQYYFLKVKRGRVVPVHIRRGLRYISTYS
jgi:hypothetical protein